ncbi:MAG TPA: chromophore lyase CpcT/CpeT [Steroidobacteraceae bacterium]|nr:chromophore lyase CpcT/CpeT [Steroidobacteraceae bacterium]
MVEAAGIVQGGGAGVFRRLAPLAALVLAALAGGCAAPPQSRQEALLTQLSAWLPGHYDNRAQVATDAKHGRPPHEAVSVTIVKVDSLTVGEHVFYLQQFRTGDPADVLAQNILSFEVVKDQIVETIYALTEPRRWREGDANPELFSSLQPDDLKMLTGCSLIWKKQAEKFTAQNDRRHCHTTPESAPAAVSSEWKIELEADALSLSDQAFDSDGDLVYGRADEPFLRLRKRSVNEL